MRTGHKLIAAVIAIVTALALGSCASPGDHGQADPRLRGQWQLVSASDAAGKIDLLNQTITLTIAGDTDTSGRSSCSDYRARFLGLSDSLWVTVTLPKNIDCGTALQQTLEERYVAALSEVRSAVLDGGDLDLMAPGVTLHYVRALFIPMTYLIGHVWQLNSVTGLSFEPGTDSASSPEHGAIIEFSGDGTLIAGTGCSHIDAHYVQNAGQVVADHVVVTAIGHCTDYTGAIDDYLVRLIDSSFTFTSARGQMSLTSTRVGITLGFVEEPTGR